MEYEPLPSVAKMLLRAASRLQDNELLPLQVPAPTIGFLYRLAKQCDHSAKPLGRFLALISASQLAEEIVRVLVCDEFKDVRTKSTVCEMNRKLQFGIKIGNVRPPYAIKSSR